VLSLGLGGLIVGLISIVQPGVWGNGYGMVEWILNADLGWKFVFSLLVLKVLATMATTGSGAVGGVFTPTLFCGAAIGSLFGEGLHAMLPHESFAMGSYAVVGMGCFLAATTRAPIV
jgi:CIC family chloride channel protein